MEKLSDELKGQIEEIQQVQQQLQLIAMQTQQLSVQQTELDKALEEVKKGPGPFYRAFSNVLVPKGKEELQKDLQEERDSVELRLSVLKKQNDKLMPRFDELRKTIEKATVGMKK